MTTPRRRSLLAAALAGAALARPGAARAQAGRLRMMFQGAPLFVQAYQGMAERFRAATGTEVQLIHAPHNEYNERVGAAVMARDLPDVLHLDAPFLANYAWSRVIRPVGGLVDRDILEDMTPSNVAQCTYPIDDRLYAVGLVDSTVLLFANRDHLSRIGARVPGSLDEAWTGAEFEAVLERLAGLPGLRWPLDLMRGTGPRTEWITYGISPIFQSVGGDLIDRRSWRAAGTLDGAASLRAGAMMQAWARRGWIVPGSAGTNQTFAAGTPASMAINGHWHHADASAALGDRLLVLPLPRFGERAVSPNGTWIWSVTQASRQPEAAGRLISFLLKDEGVRQAFRSRAGFPGLRSFAAASPLYAPGGPMAVGLDQAERTALRRPPHPAYPTITLAFQEAMDGILNNAAVPGVLRRAAGRIDADIADNDGYAPFGRRG